MPIAYFSKICVSDFSSERKYKRALSRSGRFLCQKSFTSLVYFLAVILGMEVLSKTIFSIKCLLNNLMAKRLPTSFTHRAHT